MNRLERLYAVSEELRRRAPARLSAAQLAERFGVTRRTMERDLAALRDAGLPLYAFEGRGGGYSVLDQPGRTMISLSVKEVTALLIAASSAPQAPYSDAAATATRRLLDALPDPTRISAEWLIGRVRTTDHNWPTSGKRTKRTIEEAVRQKRVVNVSYVDVQGNRTERAVEAIGFFRGERGWYLIGWCRLRQGGRMFRLDRIERANLTQDVFIERDVDETLGVVPGRVRSL